MRTIPQIRARLHELAVEYGFDELAELAEETKRRPLTRPRAKSTCGALSPEQEEQVRQFAQDNPEAAYRRIAAVFDTDIRCVSYAIAGRREAA